MRPTWDEALAPSPRSQSCWAVLSLSGSLSAPLLSQPSCYTMLLAGWQHWGSFYLSRHKSMTMTAISFSKRESLFPLAMLLVLLCAEYVPPFKISLKMRLPHPHRKSGRVTLRRGRHCQPTSLLRRLWKASCVWGSFPHREEDKTILRKSLGPRFLNVNYPHHSHY